MKRYDSYKDSGVEWIGEVPSHWEVVHLKRILREHMQYGANEPAESDNILYPRYIRITDITENSELRPETFKSLEPSKAKDYLLDKGDVLFARSGATVGKTFLFNADIKACYAGYLIKASCNRRKMLPEYLYYYTLSGAYECWKNSVFVQSTIQNIGADKYQLMYIPVPSLNEQNAMLSYLNKKCSEINKVISAQQKRIALLQELKQSIITHAVTKGLNPNVEMKDSGVEWIGNVPSHWEIKRLKWVFYNLDNLREPISAEKRERNNPQYDYYGASGVIDKIDFYNVEDKVLLIGEDGANLVFRNLPLIYKAEGKFWVNNHAHILKPRKNVDYDYMYYTLESGDYSTFITGSAQPKLSQSNLEMQFLPIPPYDEQQVIGKYLNKRCASIDSSISKAQHQVELLQEYKQSLITEVVTGKRKVS